MKILVIGDGIIDHYIYGLIGRMSPEDNSIPVVDFVEDEYRLGGAYNVAANIRSLSRKLKDEVYVSSVISTFTSELLKKKKIYYDAVVLDSKERPHKRELVKTRICRSDNHKQIVRLDNRISFSDSDLQRYKNKCFYYNMKDFDAVVVSDYNKGLINDFVLEKLKNFNGPIFVDTKNPDFDRWTDLNEKVIFKLNYKEWSNIVWPTKSFTTVVTLGPEGATLLNCGCFVDTYKTQKISNGDPIGAGDVFLSGLVVKYMETKDLVKSVKYANKVATLSVQRFGTCEIKRGDIDENS